MNISMSRNVLFASILWTSASQAVYSSQEANFALQLVQLTSQRKSSTQANSSLAAESSPAPLDDLAKDENAGAEDADVDEDIARMDAETEMTMSCAFYTGHHGIWAAMEQTAAYDESLCDSDSGKLLPQLFLLGVQKASTTSLSGELIGAGVQCIKSPNADEEKPEVHFFDGRMDWSCEKRANEECSAQKKAWLEELSPCPEQGKRVLAADFTPDYLRMVSVPTGWAKSGHFPPYAQDVEALNLPSVLRSFYGPLYSQKLAFITLLREPLARMQSAWYHANSTDFHVVCSSCRAASFTDALQDHLHKFTQTPVGITDWLWAGMYGYHLQGWLKAFEPSQFLVVPFKYASSDTKDGICKQISKMASFEIDCDSHDQEALHEWSHPHPPLEEDLGSSTLRNQFDGAMQSHNKLLISVLQKGYEQGMKLAWSGRHVGGNAMQEWLESGW